MFIEDIKKIVRASESRKNIFFGYFKNISRHFHEKIEKNCYLSHIFFLKIFFPTLRGSDIFFISSIIITMRLPNLREIVLLDFSH